MNPLRPLTMSEKSEMLALIGLVLGSVEPTFSPRDDYYRDVLERVAESLADFGIVEVAPYRVRKQVYEVAEEHARKQGRTPAA